MGQKVNIREIRKYLELNDKKDYMSKVNVMQLRQKINSFK